MVRTKISQSSALRQKRGHAAVNQRPDGTETEAPEGLNNGPYSQTEKNGRIHANGTAAEPETFFDKIEEFKISNTANKEEEEQEESFSTDSLSEISKFESEFTFCIIEETIHTAASSLKSVLEHSHITQRCVFVSSLLSSSQPRPELPA